MTNCEIIGAPQTQGKRCGLVQHFICERAYCGGSFATVPSQEFQRSGLRELRMFARVLGIQFGNRFPGHVRHRPAAGGGPREIYLDRVHTGNMVHDETNRAMITC
jgi:hypothetical protein